LLRSACSRRQAWAGAVPSAARADALLDEIVSFTGEILYLQSNVPGLVIGAVRNGETTIHGFGEAADGGEAPDGDTLLRIGSITKAFTGHVLASLAADGTVSLTQKVDHPHYHYRKRHKHRYSDRGPRHRHKYDRHRHGPRYKHRRPGFRFYFGGYWYSNPWWSYSVPRRYYVNRHVEWCLGRYRSYNPRTDMYLGYDGHYHRCRSPYR